MSTTLYLMLGFPGAGKTSAAKIISKISGAEHIWADFERRKIHGTPTYTQSENDELYHSLNNKTRQLLESGKSVIYDTAFNHQKDREKMRDLAHRLKVKTIIVWVKVPKSVARERAQNIGNHLETRLLGSMTDEQFDHLIKKLEQPHADEKVIELDGLKLTEKYIKTKLKI